MGETAEEIQEKLRLEKVAADKEGRAVRLGPEIPEPDIEPAVGIPSPRARALITKIRAPEVEPEPRRVRLVTPPVSAAATPRELGFKAVPEVKKTSFIKTAFQAVTPWQEQAGETFVGHMKTWPKRTLDTFKVNISGKIPAQDKLKADLESYNRSNVFIKMLGDPPAVFDKGSGKYLQLAIGYGPAGGARKGVIQNGKKLVQTLGPKEAGMSRAMFERFIKARVQNPTITPAAFKTQEATKVSWKTLSEAIRKGKIKSKRDAAKLATKPKEPAKKLTRSEASRARIAERRIERKIDAAIRTPAPTVGSKALAGIVTEGISLQVSKWLKMSPAQAAKSISDSKMAAGAVVAEPQSMVVILGNMQPEVAIDLMNDTAAQVRTMPLTAEEMETAIQQVVDVDTKVITETAIQTANEAKAEGATDTQVKQQVAQQVATQTETLTDTEVKTKVQQKVEAITEQAVKTKVATGTGVRSGKSSKPTKSKVMPRPRIPKPKQEKANRRQIKAAKGAIAFRTGELNKKDVWRVIMWPYRQVDMVTVLGRTPQGAVAVRGPESARRTAIKIGRAPSKELMIDMGFQDVTVTPLGEKNIKLGFKPDPKLETTLPLTVTGTGKAFPLEDKAK